MRQALGEIAAALERRDEEVSRAQEEAERVAAEQEAAAEALAWFNGSCRVEFQALRPPGHARPCVRWRPRPGPFAAAPPGT